MKRSGARDREGGPREGRRARRTSSPQQWFAEHRVAIKELPRRAAAGVRGHPGDGDGAAARRAAAAAHADGGVRRSSTSDGQIALAPLATEHLMSDEDGQFPLRSLNDWEREVVARG